jgi:ATP-binding cassette subfamily F protein 3
VQLKNLEKELKKIEERIENLQNTRTSLESEMSLPEVYSDFEKLAIIQEKFNGITKELDAANTKWEEVATAIDQLNQ